MPCPYYRLPYWWTDPNAAHWFVLMQNERMAYRTASHAPVFPNDSAILLNFLYVILAIMKLPFCALILPIT